MNRLTHLKVTLVVSFALTLLIFCVYFATVEFFIPGYFRGFVLSLIM